MALINTNGLALIGPGSEWFWASAQFFVVAVTLLGVHRQLRVQAGANAFNIMQAHERDWDSERMTRAKLDVLLAWRDGDDRADLPDAAAGLVAEHFTGLAYLAEKGVIERGVVLDTYGGLVRSWWAILEQYVRHERELARQERLWSTFEWLAGEMDARHRRRGTTAAVERDTLMPSVSGGIERARERVQEFDASRTITARLDPTPVRVAVEPFTHRHADWPTTGSV